MIKNSIVMLGLLMVIGAPLAAAPVGGQAVFVVPEQLQWKSTDTPGVEMALVEGDYTKGPSHLFIRFKPGVSAPAHYHHADHFTTVVNGTMILEVDGKQHRLPPGSYFALTGMKPHATKCDVGAPCVISLDVRDKWDVIMADANLVGKSK